MRDIPRRAVVLGAGLLVGVAGSPLYGAPSAPAEPGPDDVPDLGLLRRTFVLADEARQAGGSPYGALVAGADGTVIAEHRNSTRSQGGDPT